jgi:hypothetical protein
MAIAAVDMEIFGRNASPLTKPNVERKIPIIELSINASALKNLTREDLQASAPVSSFVH